jgi:divalent metal cation (Fe/Co/Zn/Cd) transporter
LTGTPPPERRGAVPPGEAAARLARRGMRLEVVTLAWNVAGIIVLTVAAIGARSVALAGFGLDSLIEIGASTVVLWELSGTGDARQEGAVRLIGSAFVVLAAYLAVQSTWLLAIRFEPRHSLLGMAWTAATAVVMLWLAAAKGATGRALSNPVLVTEGRVTAVDAVLAAAVLAGLAANALLGWWWADPIAAYAVVVYGINEGVAALRHRNPASS